MPSASRTVLHVVLIKPSRYADDGYPLRWSERFFPSSTLACLNGLVTDCRQRRVLGDDVEIEIETHDETSAVIDIDGIADRIAANGGRAFIGLVGVQTNQFPRAVDIGARFRRDGLQVCIGGFHVSGCLALLPEMPAELREAQGLGISLFAGEAEGGRLDQLLRDAWAGQLQPLYNFLAEAPPIEGEPVPILPDADAAQIKFDYSYSTFDLSRGCPFECSFCSVINFHGRKSRWRSADDLEKIVRAQHEQGVRRFFITDDNFVRNKNWQALLDRFILLRETAGLEFRLTIQVDMLSHKNPVFVEKAVRAGVDELFVGLENINPDNLAAMNKRQNKIDDYRQCLLAWKRHPVVIIAGYIIGLPNDTRESVLRDIETVKRELPVDVLSISSITPLPGSVDHKRLLEAGVWMDPDLSKYDLTHRVIHHPRMSDAEWDRLYQEAFDAYYTWEHMETVLRRASALGSCKKYTTALLLLVYRAGGHYFGTYSIDGTISRIRRHDERRPGLPRESWLAFHYRNIREGIVARYGMARDYRRLYRLADRLWADPARLDYRDAAIAPIDDGGAGAISDNEPALEVIGSRDVAAD